MTGLAVIDYQKTKLLNCCGDSITGGGPDRVGRPHVPDYAELGEVSRRIMLYPISAPKPDSPENLIGYIDRSGRIIVNPVYDAGSWFSEGLASICREDGVSSSMPLVS